MLTGELLRVRRKGEEIVPRYLSTQVRQRLEPTAAALISRATGCRGLRRAELGAALDEVPCRPADRIVVAGLRKLLLDRCEFVVSEGADPAELRDLLFRRAAAARRELASTERLDADALVAAIAAERDIAPSDLRERLFADLRDNERLSGFRPIDEAELLVRYDLALAQAVLLRAQQVILWLDGEAPAGVRQLFRAARFHGLLHQVFTEADGAYRVQIDGPLSLFSANKRYGLQLAMFLPAVLRCRGWRLEAQLLWGRSREQRSFRLGPEQGLSAPGARRASPTRAAVHPSVIELLERFGKLGSSWDARPNERIFALPGEVVCVPDVVFESRETGELVYLEVFGFWSRQAVWQRVETIRRGFSTRMILAVGKHLRVSEEVLGEDDAGELYVYRTKMSPRALLERLEHG